MKRRAGGVLLRLAAAAAALGIVVACAGSGDTVGGGPGGADGGIDATFPGDANGGAQDAGTPEANATAPGDDASSDAGPTAVADAADAAVCATGEAYCVDHATTSTCTGGAWVTTPCASGSGCFQGACVASACSDECNLGDTRGAETCTLVNVGTGLPVTPQPGTDLHDRARAYNEFLRSQSLTYGGIGDPRYADTTYKAITSMNDIADSAIWTGTYLASEAMRLMATGSSDARVNLRTIIDTLHLWMNVEGDPGVLSRFVAPAGQRPSYALSDIDCASATTHCAVPYDGGSYDILGHISRDQYQGVMLGYALAYQALTSEDEDERAKIRADAVALVEELMKERTVNVTLTFNGVLPLTQTVTMRFVVLVSREETSGGIDIAIDTSNLSAATMTGFQEFTPDLADIVRQFPGLSGTPSIARASSAIMLASFFRVALLVTDGVPAYKAQHDAIESYYLTHSGTGGNIHDWLGVAATFADTNACGQSYYGNNITMEPLYNLGSLETDPTLLGTLRSSVIESHVWPAFVSTKNVFFSYIYAGVDPSYLPGVVTSAGAQLAQFPPPLRVDVAVDWSDAGKYAAHQAGCTNQCDHASAVDVGDRVPDEFIWQRDPWELVGGGDLQQTYPGVDYLIAYWMGRKHGFLTDANSGNCLVFR